MQQPAHRPPGQSGVVIELTAPCPYRIDAAGIFGQTFAQARVCVEANAFRRTIASLDGQLQVVLDSMKGSGATCAFLRLRGASQRTVSLEVPGKYELLSVRAGGWLLRALARDTPSYWFPALAVSRRINEDSQIEAERSLPLTGVRFSEREAAFTVDGPPEGWAADFVVWHLEGAAERWLGELDVLSTVEQQPVFMYGSHSRCACPADVYAHLAHGTVYDTQFIWPKYRRIADELDAYGLYLMLGALDVATDKTLYALLRRQVLYSVIARQGKDGAWRHGEWTDFMECHVRLHCGGMHLLLTALEEWPCPVVESALRKAAAFVATLADRTQLGTWFLHDSLEQSEESMRQGPFPWRASRALGKSPSNMLVLNTQLDTLVALDRYRQVTGDRQFDDTIASGVEAALALLNRRPLEWLYALVYRWLDLTLLPVEQARRLPVVIRALKRMAWKYVASYVHVLRSWAPRLVMPNGFIERAVNQRGFSQAYQPVNLWDLIRFRQRFPQAAVSSVIAQGLAYTQHGSLRAFWREHKKRPDALGFWTDALWHLCLADPDPRYRAWLAEAMIYSEDAGIGMAPALLGANTEAVPVASRHPCPSPVDRRLRIANLGRGARGELVVANPAKEDIALAWQGDVPALTWQSSAGPLVGRDLVVPGRGWVWGVAGT